MTRFILALIIVIALVTIGYFTYGSGAAAPAPTPTDTPSKNTGASQGKLMSVEAYVTQNISALSPIKEDLGGTFYVTEITVDPGMRKGVVKYEDGHNAYVAEFTYTSSDRTGHTITSFVIRD
jgi:hypothetical protein